MEIRDWLIFGCIVVIAFIAWDAWRRAKAKNSYNGKFTKPKADKDDNLSEVRSRPATDAEVDHGRRTLRLDDDEDEPVPMLIDEYDQSEALASYQERREPGFVEGYDEGFDEQGFENHSFENQNFDEDVIDEPVERDAKTKPAGDKAQEASVEELPPADEVLIIHVFAKSGQTQLDGADLLHNLLAANLKHGSMDIFHSHDDQGRLQFSLANGVNPGTLNPDTLPDQTTPGISLFLQLPHAGDAKASLDHMYKVAKYLGEEFSAAVLDDQRSVLTPQTIEHYQQRIVEYQRSQMIPS